MHEHHGLLGAELGHGLWPLVADVELDAGIVLCRNGELLHHQLRPGLRGGGRSGERES
jgi:hypothetical protein